MKRLSLVLVSLLVMTFAVQAQYIFEKGDFGLNAGIGIGGNGGAYIPSIEITGEFGVIPTGDIGLVSFGGMLGYKYSVDTYNYVYFNDSYDYSQFQFGARAAWHLHTFTSDQWDVYAGAGVGLHLTADNTVVYNYDTEKYEEKTSARSEPYGDVFVGGRMMFNSGFGLFAEVGYSYISFARFGLTFVM